jgi:hypothetical protein
MAAGFTGLFNLFLEDVPVKSEKVFTPKRE